MKSHILAPLLALLLVAAGALGASSKKPRTQAWASGADQRKADMLFMEAQRHTTLGSEDAFYDLMSRSWELDTAATAPYQLGYYTFALGQDGDSLLAAKGFDMMRQYFDHNPADYYAGLFYGSVNNRLGNTAEAVRIWTRLDSLNPDRPDVALNLAQALLEAADTASLRRALGVLEGLQRSQGPDLGLTSHKVRALMALRDTAATLAEVGALLATAPSNATYHVYAADLFDALQMPDSAMAHYDYACRADSTNGLAYYRRAEHYRERADSASFDREVFRALRMESLPVEVKLEMLRSYIGQLYTDTLQRPRIEQLFDALLLQHPADTRIRDLFTSYLLVVERPEAAAEQQSYILDLEPASEERWQTTISLYVTAGDTLRARALSRQALHYHPLSPQMHLIAAGIDQSAGHHADALPLLRRARALAMADTLPPGPDSQLLSQIMGATADSYYTLEQPDSAFAAYDEALLADPDNALALNNYAYFMACEGGDLDRAQEMVEKCLRSNPDNDTALDTYAWILFQKKQYAHALEVIDHALQIEHDTGQEPPAEILHHAGDIYYMNGQPEKALELWTQALRLDPDNALLRKKVTHKTHFFQ